ncbi:SUR7/PalI family protein, partial [Eubacteriales bacterium OttesenSCG-928-M02]|nr:SUR7/PalI family protein [Eubacteriales bacterium OttesenSCG-928-M02]
QELKETVMKVADYSNVEKQRLAKRMRTLSIVGLVALLIYIVMVLAGIVDKSPILEHISSFALGFAFSLLALSVIVTGRYASKFQAIKSRVIHRNDAEEN